MLTFKKLSSFVLSVVMICSLCASGFAFGVFATETTESEEKVYCEATLADDFSDSRVLVVVDSLTSWKLEDFSLSDFAEVDCTAVKNLTALTQECLREKFEFVRASAERLRNGEILFPENFEGVDINPDTFKQILCLELNTPGKENVLEAIKALEKLPFVHYAGPAYTVSLQSSTDSTSTDPLYEEQWGLSRIGIEEAWAKSTGAAWIRVGIIDSGIDGDHPDLANRIDRNLSRNFLFENPAAEGALTDVVGHGTMVAGVIGAERNNGEGISGVAPNVTLVSLKVIADNGRFPQHDETGEPDHTPLIRAIDYANAQEIPILNCSLGWLASSEEITLRSMLQAYNGLFVCSAGNDNQDNDSSSPNALKQYPSCIDLPNIFSVGASDQSDGRWIDTGDYADIINGSSNYGKVSVDIFAPGDQIVTCFPTNLCGEENEEEHYADNYHYFCQTSAAASFVTGVAALLLAKDPDLTATDLKYIIMNTADGNNFEDYCVSGGRLSAAGALHDHDYTDDILNINSPTVHEAVCSICEFWSLQKHIWQFDDEYSSENCSNEGHDATCRVCGYSGRINHTYTYAPMPNNSMKHIGECTVCGYTCTETHSWVSYLTYMKCSKCGKRSTTVIIPGAAIPNEEETE